MKKEYPCICGFLQLTRNKYEAPKIKHQIPKVKSNETAFSAPPDSSG
jgi:hypothetical protein